MAKTFKGQSRPGQFQNLFPAEAAFEDTERLVRANEREKAERSNRRKALSGRNRDNLNSLQASFGPAAEGRNLALSNERAKRGQETRMRQARILEAQESANRNAQAQAAQSIKARNDIANLIKDVGGTAVDLYQTFDKLDLEQSKKTLFKINATLGGLSTEQVNRFRSMNLDLIGEGQKYHETWKEWLSLGGTENQARQFLGVRHEAIYALKSNTLLNDATNLVPKLRADDGYNDLFETAAVPGGEGWAVVKNHILNKAHELAIIGADADTNSALMAPVYEKFTQILAAEKARFEKTASANAAIEKKNQDTELTLAAINTHGSGRSWATWVANKASESPNPRGHIEDQVSNLTRLIQGAEGAELQKYKEYFEALANSSNPSTPTLQYDQTEQFGKIFSDARALIYKTRNQEIKNNTLENNEQSKFYQEQVDAIVSGEVEKTPAQIEALVNEINQSSITNKANHLGRLKHYQENETPKGQGEATFYSKLNTNWMHVTAEEVRAGKYGTDHASINKMLNSLETRKRRDEVRKANRQRHADLVKTRLGYSHGDKTDESGTEALAVLYLNQEYDRVRKEVFDKSNGDTTAANDAAMKHVDALLGQNKHEGPLAVPDRSDPKQMHKKGFFNLPIGKGGAVNIPGDSYTDIHNKFNANGNKKPNDRLKEFLDPESELSENLLSSEEALRYRARPEINPGIQARVQYIKKLTGFSGTGQELVEKLLTGRNVDLPPTYADQVEAATRELNEEFAAKFGTRNATLLANNNLLRRGEVNFSPSNVTSIVRENDSGEPGLDLYLEDKKAGAVLPGVVKYIGNQLNADGSGYGNYVVIESINPINGQPVDVLYAHAADNSMRIRVGDTVSYGTHIFTQGGTGSVRSVDGTIFSMDFLEAKPPGSTDMTPAAGWKDLREHIINTLRGGQSQQPPLNERQSIPTPNNINTVPVEDLDRGVRTTRGGIKYWFTNDGKLNMMTPDGQTKRESLGEISIDMLEVLEADTENT